MADSKIAIKIRALALECIQTRQLPLTSTLARLQFMAPFSSLATGHGVKRGISSTSIDMIDFVCGCTKGLRAYTKIASCADLDFDR